MATKVKVTVRSYLLEKGIPDILRTRFGKEAVARLAIDEMRDSISKGVSPVRGERRFERYKDKKVYPAGIKPSNPVNLNLSGDMLAALDYKPSARGVLIGIFDPKEAAKARGHQLGLNGVPRRRFIPAQSGEVFTVSITRKVRDLLSRLISEIIR